MTKDVERPATLSVLLQLRDSAGEAIDAAEMEEYEDIARLQRIVMDIQEQPQILFTST